MTAGDRDELLSAYLDREVTPEERAEVEARLDASPDSRAELDALAELSLCLRTLDRPQAPEDFQASVMQALAGRTVAPAAAVSPRRRSRREWTVSIIATALTACGLLFAVTNWNQSPQSFTESRVSRTMEATGAIDGVTATPAPAHFALESVMNSDEARSRFLRMQEAGDNTHVNRPALSATGDLQMAPMTATKANTLPEAMLVAGDQPAYSTEFKETSGKPLEKVALNQFLEMWAATDATDRYVANIDLQVLDVRKSADTFQVLLHNNSVVTLQDRESGITKKTDDQARPKDGTPLAENPVVVRSDDSSMIAVYVDTSVDRVTKSLEELAQRHDVLSVRLQQPLALARLAEDGITPQREQAEALQRAEVEELANAYVEQQIMSLSDLEVADPDAPVDALFAVENSKSERTETSRTRNRAMQVPGIKQQVANRGMSPLAADAMRTKDAANTTAGVAVNNYSTVVRLPVLNPLEVAQNNALANTTQPGGDNKLNRWSDAKPDPLQYGNTQRRVSQQQTEYGTNTPANSRQRNFYRENASNPVRVLVVFQDPPTQLKAKAASP
ncbi:MAG TPA: zf-HC2 domain-containing protein [Planctomycetaceae bacterium]|nr:zf-HC2 domain-containing protein [Planctomycetaceae bacterium]